MSDATALPIALQPLPLVYLFCTQIILLGNENESPFGTFLAAQEWPFILCKVLMTAESDFLVSVIVSIGITVGRRRRCRRWRCVHK